MSNPIEVVKQNNYPKQALLKEECRNIFENNLSIMMIIDPVTGRIIDANKSAIDFYLYPKEKFLTMTIFEINILTQEEILAKMKQVKGDKKLSFVFNHKLADDSIKTVRVLSSKIILNDKDYLFSVIYDNTEFIHLENEHIIVEKQLKDSLIFNQNLIKNASEGIIVYDKDLRYTIWNNFMAKTTGLSASQVLGKKTTEIFSQGTYSEVTEGLLRALQGEVVTLESVEFLNPITNESGFTREVYSPNYDSDGNIIGVVCIISDVTSIVKYQRSLALKNKELEELNTLLSTKMIELEIAKEKAEESDRLKSAFLAHISHEIRTPLNSIVGFSNLLKDVNDKELIEKYSNIINSHNLYLLNIIENTLTYSLIESKGISINLTKLDIISLLKDIYSNFKQSSHNNLQIKLQLLNLTSFVTVTDESKLTQILMNFLTNSLKFTYQGEIEFGIHSYTSESIRLFVKDTGIGIEKSYHDKIFDRFFKLDTIKPGSGLGLSICLALSEILKGKISLESALGNGSTFYIEIPNTYINQGATNER